MAVNPGSISWGTDTEVSMPEPLPANRQALIDMGGFSFTIRGIAHDFTETDREVFLMPTFSPDFVGMAGEVPE
jgi:hypothetical protein